MESENKRLKVLIVILLVFLVAFGGYYFYEKVVSVNNNENPNEKINDIITSTDTEKEYTKEELLTLLEGTWYSCGVNSLGNQMCYVRNFYDNNFYGGIYGSDGGYGGEVKSISLLEKNKYVLVTYNPGCHGINCIDEKDPQYDSFIIDITNISNKTIIIDGVEINYAAKDVESASKIIDSIQYN